MLRELWVLGLNSHRDEPLQEQKQCKDALLSFG